MKRQSIAALVFLILSILIVGLCSLFTPLIEQIEFKNYDFMMFLRGTDQKPENLVIVAIDRFSLDVFEKELGMSWPWDRTVYADLIESLTEAGAKVIGFDVIFDLPSNPDSDRRFSEAIRNSEIPVVLASTIEKVVTKNYLFEKQVLPIEVLMDAGGIPALSMISPDRDAVVRHAQLTLNGKETLVLALYRLVRETLDFSEIPILDLDINDPKILINYVGYPHGIETVSFFQALKYKNHLPKNIFHNQVVLVGRSESIHDLVARAGGADMFNSPITLLGGNQQIPGVEVQANIFNTISKRKFIRKASSGLMVFLTLALGIAVSILMLIIPKSRDKILWSMLVVFGFIGLTWFGFIRFDYWILGFQPFLVGLITVALNTVYQYQTSEKNRQKVEQMLRGYVSKDVVETIKKDPTKLKLGGVEVTATVLFSDIVNFSEVSENVSPHELSSKLNDYFTNMGDVIMHNQGMINKYIGDSIMAIWGAPLKNENHAVLACQAALEMKCKLKEREKFGFRSRYGLNSGTMVAGNLGHHERMEYTVIGDAVNLASRLEGANKIFGTAIMISETTEKRVQGHFITRQLDIIRVRGRFHPVKVYELVAAENRNTSDKVREMVDSFKEILETYSCQNWDMAYKLARVHLSAFPNDTVANVYMSRCQKYIGAPPPANWDGVYELTQK